jgi:hypothetical protein
LQKTFISGRVPADGISRACATWGRVVLLFTALLLVVMPLTEYLYHFDKFLRGGEDVEFGLLSLATICALALVLSQCIKQRVVIILAVRRWLSFHIQEGGQTAFADTLVTDLRAMFVSCPLLSLYNLPIQV